MEINREIDGFWIIHTQGKIIFSHTKNRVFDTHLIGGLISALNSFANLYTKSDLHRIEFDSSLFHMIKDKSFLFVANASKNVSSISIERILRLNITKFYHDYPDRLLDFWEENMGFFQDFTPQLQEPNEDPLDKLKNTLW